MKFDRIIWGVLLLFIGGVLLLENLNIIDFYWRSVWSFWPVFIIILGVNILFNRNNSQTGNIISLVILVVTLSILFVKGQQKPDRAYAWEKFNYHNDFDDNNNDNEDDSNDNEKRYTQLNFAEPFTAGDESKKNTLNISGGGITFDLKSSTDSLFTASVKKRSGDFSLNKVTADSVNTLTFKMQNKRGNWSGSNNVDIKLNTLPIWEMNVNMGAGSVDFDLSNYKVRTFNFDGGAAALDVKIGNLLQITDVNVKTGVADVKIDIPETSGCRIKTKTGLSAKDFTGFTKLDNGVYETPNYKTSTKKIFINLDGGLSNFEVKRY